MPATGFVDELHQSVADRTDGISGWLMPEEAEELYALAHAHGDVMLEVGTFRGRSATVLNLGARGRPQRQFFSVDIDPSSGIHALEALRRFGVDGRAFFFHGGLDAFRARIKIAPTFAFIDGDHTYEGVRRDTDLLSTLLLPGIPVVFHDYLNPSTPGVLRAVNEWVEQGFAVLTKTCGTCAVTSTTAKCTGRAAELGEVEFRALLAAQKKGLAAGAGSAAVARAKDRIARSLPWLVPIVRTIKGRRVPR
jgi:predicted O-methyltransferase YrrM